MNIAHKKENSNEIQTVAEHSISTATLASSFAIAPLKNFIYDIALMHDIGKYQKSFQNKINAGSEQRVEHAACGAAEFPKAVNTGFALMAQYCIAGHHTGLPDGGDRTDTDYTTASTLSGRLSHTERFDDYSAYKDELVFRPVSDGDIIKLFSDIKGNNKEDYLERYAFLTRYCFSCLTDADSLDTAHFCTGREDKELVSDFEVCLRKLNFILESFYPETELQKARSRVQKQVYANIEEDADIYLMNMPTGSGKTLCSMKFALERAIKTGRRRIIYVIPYNSIIDQTATVFENIFRNSASIVRHQSSFCYDDTDLDEDYKNHIKNAVENWNAQIIITTSVQFFESVYKNKRSRLRKLHNMADSIIVFDEVHIMPVNYLKPCLRAVSNITKLLNSEAVFLTATMPDFEALVRKYSFPSTIVRELVTDKKDFPFFKKGDYTYIGEVSEEELIAKMSDYPSVLIVVNKRKTASSLYQKVQGKKYHLSTYMSAFDRQNTIHQIRRELENLYADYPNLQDVPIDRRITVVSTSLIEAGVDLDFHTVCRELSGLDSILQAGGRCNREGRRTGAKIMIFNFGNACQNGAVNITKALLQEYDDISDDGCIREYYSRLFDFCDEEVRRQTIAADCGRPQNIPFSTYAKSFNMIDSRQTIAVAVGCDETSSKLIDTLKAVGFTNYHKLQKYTCTVYENELEDLLRQGAVKEYGGVFCLINPDYYSKETGICFEATDYYI